MPTYDQNNGYNQQYPPQYRGVRSAATVMPAVMRQVYLKMMLGLAVTGFVAWFCANSQAFMTWMANTPGMMWVFIIAEFALVIGISAGINKLSGTTATLLFYLFAVVNALMLAPIFIVYTHTSIAKTFFITAGSFGAMSIYGYCTNKDLSKMGSILFFALIGLIIASLVNIFMKSSTMEWIISCAGVVIFVGLTAWDTQQIKNMAMMNPNATDGRLSTLGALSLYLDFINLFLYLLRFFGNSRD